MQFWVQSQELNAGEVKRTFCVVFPWEYAFYSVFFFFLNVNQMLLEFKYMNTKGKRRHGMDWEVGMDTMYCYDMTYDTDMMYETDN